MKPRMQNLQDLLTDNGEGLLCLIGIGIILAAWSFVRLLEVGVPALWNFASVMFP